MKIKIFFLVLIFIASMVTGGISGTLQDSYTAATSTIVSVRQIINETTEDFWTDTELLSWINDGLKDIAAVTGCLEATEDILLISGELEYPVRQKFTRVIAAIYSPTTSPKSLARTQPLSADHAEPLMPSFSDPDDWYEWDETVGVSPLAISEITGNAVRLYIAAIPEEITSTDIIPIPAFYDKALTYFVASFAHLKERNIRKYVYYFSLYEKELDRFRMDYALTE